MEDSKEPVNQEQFIQEFIKDVPEDKKAVIELACRTLPYHLKESGKTPEEVTKILDDIDFPQELR